MSSPLLLLTTALSLVAALACACGSGSSTSPATPGTSTSAPASADAAVAEASPPPAPPAPTSIPGSEASNPAPKGTAYTVNNIETTVTGAKFTKKAKEKYFDYTAGEGATLLIVDYSVKNTGTKPVTCMTYADSVTDAKGIKYDATSDCSMAIKSWALEQLNPGLNKKYQACFEVPEGTELFTATFNCSWQDGYFALGI